jgi:hypothetical protein
MCVSLLIITADCEWGVRDDVISDDVISDDVISDDVISDDVISDDVISCPGSSTLAQHKLGWMTLLPGTPSLA